jgi:predicted alpha/beta-fold hydrolase
VTRDEVIAIMGIMKAAYPSYYKDMRREDAHQIIELWAMMFVDDNAAIVTEAIKAMIVTLKYPPSIADVKEKIRLITQPEQQTELEAWGIVLAAIKDANYHAQEHFDKFPPVIQKIIGSPNQLREWAMMESDTTNSVIQSNFMRSYTAKMKNEQQMQALPNSTKNMIARLQEKIKMIGEIT